jgi:hypothetical protein
VSMELINAAAMVREYGIEAAREFACSAHERRLVQIAHEVMSDEQQAMGIGYSGMCLTSLPYRKLSDDKPWVRKGHMVTLMIEPGYLLIRGKPVRYGVPYGSRGRILLIHLMTQAVRNNSREVTLGRSAKNALERMGLTYGGESSRAIRDQGARLAACSLRWAWEYDNGDTNHRGSIITSSFRLHDEDERQQSLFSDAVMLDEEFFAALKKHPVPFVEEAIRQLSHSPMSIDIYAWLGYRLHSLKRPTDISWPSLAAQFGPNYKTIRQFRADFILSLQEAYAAYPDAEVELIENGLRLHPSPPPVSKIVAPRCFRWKAVNRACRR